jgi:cysteine desulfurase/selenocysteine lyase
LNLEVLNVYLTERTKLVAVTGMSNVLGTINPIGEISKRAKAVGALVLVDAAQSVPHGLMNVQDLAVDFLAFSGHKVFGPSGVGVLYGRKDLLETMDPFLCGGHMISRVYKDHSEYADPPMKFEAGTLPIAQAIALRSAIEYLKRIGFDAIHAQERDLLEYATNRLQEIPGLSIYGPSLEHKGSICSFTIDKVHPEDLANLLDRCGVFVRHGHHCTMPLHDLLKVPATTRASLWTPSSKASTTPGSASGSRTSFGVRIDDGGSKIAILGPPSSILNPLRDLPRLQVLDDFREDRRVALLHHVLDPALRDFEPLHDFARRRPMLFELLGGLGQIQIRDQFR